MIRIPFFTISLCLIVFFGTGCANSLFRTSILKKQNNGVTTSTLTFQFNKLPSPYTTNGSNVYFYKNMVVGADPKTFVALTCTLAFESCDSNDDSVFAKDINHAYKGSKLWIEADPTTLEVVGQGVLKDKNRVYYGSVDDSKIDPATFVSLGSSYYKDKNHFYLAGNILSISDTNTFTLLGNTGYAKDSQHVFFNNSAEGVVINGADPKTFTTISGFDNWYAKDVNHVYFKGTIIPELESSTLSVVSQNYLKDAKIVYFQNGLDKNNVIKDADPATFLPIQIYDNLWSKDAKHVYFNGDLIPLADPGTFTALNGRYGKDKNRGFFMDKIFPNVNITTFTANFQDVWYAKDNNHVYNYGAVIAEADPQTFNVVFPDQNCGDNCVYRAYDKNHKYDYNGKIIQ